MVKNEIYEIDVLESQKLWAKNIIDIGNLYVNKGEYKTKAYNFVKKFYAYEISNVLFKPTLASKNQFRYTFEDALSYFIGGSIKEDKGFALKPWNNIRFGEKKIVIMDQIAFAMGNYYFQSIGQKEEIKVEYTFGYLKGSDGQLVINIHHSSLPYKNDHSNIG